MKRGVVRTRKFFFFFRRKEKAIAKKKEMAGELATVSSTSGLAKTGKKGKVNKGTPKPCPKAVAAVQELLTRSFAALPPGQEEWLIVVDFTEGGTCWHQQAVSLGGAAAITALYAKRVGSSVTVVAPGVDVVQLETDSSVSETVATFQKVCSYVLNE